MLQDEKHHFWKISAVMLGLAPPLIVLGPAVMATPLLLGLVLGLVATKGDSLRSTATIIKQSRFLYIGLAVLALMGVLTLFALNPVHSLNKWSQLVAVALGVLLFFLALREMPPRYAHLLLKVFCLTSIVVTGVVFSDVLSGGLLLGFGKNMTETSFLNRSQGFSATLMVFLPFVWAWLFRSYREQVPVAQRFAFPFTLFSIVTVIICGGWAGVVALMVSGAVFVPVCVKRFHMSLTMKGVLLVLASVIVGIAGLYLVHGSDFVVIQVNKLQLLIGERLGHDGLWAFSFQHLMDAPLNGVGVGGFRFIEGAQGSHPQNFLLQMILETGVVVTSFLLFLLGYAFVYFAYFARGNMYGLAGLCSLLSFMLVSLGYGSVFEPKWIALLFFIGVFTVRIGWFEPASKNLKRKKK